MKGRTLLASLFALPACEAAVADDDPQVPDGGNPSKFDDSCRSYFESVYACYADESGTGGSTGEIDLDQYVETYCGELRATAEAYGEGCLGAYEEIFACIASLECAPLADDDTGGEQDTDGEETDDSGFDPVPEPCHDVFRDAVERCPDGVPACTTLSFGGGSEGSCNVGGSNCIDGHEYGVECMDGSCDCLVDDAVVRSITLPSDLDCLDETWLEEARTACDFPIRPF